MIKPITVLLKVVLIFYGVLFNYPSIAATFNVTPSDNLAQIIWDASNGDTIILAEGTYLAQPTIYSPSDPVFHIIRAVTIKSSGSAANTILKVDSSYDQVVKIHPASYTTTSGQSFITDPSGATLQGVTLEGAHGGILVRDFQDLVDDRLSNIHLSHLTVNLTAPTSGHGIELNHVDHSFLESNIIHTAYANAIYVLEGRYNILSKNLVENTLTQHSIGIQGGLNNKIVDNTITGSAADGIILLYSINNRVERNNIQGFTVDGITATDGSNSNFIAFNTIISNGKQANRNDGTGIWLNCSSNNNIVLGNNVSGSPENGLTIFSASNNILIGNNVYDNFDGGIFIWNNQDFCLNPSYPGETPQHNFIKNNYSHYNVSNAMINIRGGVNSEVGFNFLSGLNHFESDLAGTNTGGVTLQSASNIDVFGNTTTHVNNAIFNFSDVQNALFFQNRYFDSLLKYATFPAVVTLDAGDIVGGNFWSDFPVTGNPSSGQPFTDIIFDSIGNRGGIYADNYPFANETLGRSYEVNILSPIDNQIITNSTLKLINWHAQGCLYVDLSLIQSDGSISIIESNYPNTGFYSWNPSLISAGSYSISIACKNSAGASVGVEDVVNALTVSNASDLSLISPSAGETLSAGSLVRVAWTKSVNTGNINVYLSADNQAETMLASNVDGSYVDIQLPLTTSNNVRLRIASTNNQTQDETDGTFSIQNEIPTILSPTQTSNWQLGDTTKILWNSPFSSIRVNIDIKNGSNWISVVKNLPDRGEYSWIIRGLLASNNNHIRIQYFDNNGQQLPDANSESFYSNLITCQSDLNSSLLFTLPTVLVDGNFYSTSLSHSPTIENSFSWVLEQSPEAITSNESCQPASYVNGQLYIPNVIFNGQSYWATLLLTSSDGKIRFNLAEFGQSN